MRCGIPSAVHSHWLTKYHLRALCSLSIWCWCVRACCQGSSQDCWRCWVFEDALARAPSLYPELCNKLIFIFTVLLSLGPTLEKIVATSKSTHTTLSVLGCGAGTNRLSLAYWSYSEVDPLRVWTDAAIGHAQVLSTHLFGIPAVHNSLKIMVASMLVDWTHPSSAWPNSWKKVTWW